MRKIRVFINGFGRIGRACMRQILRYDTFEIVGINDVYDPMQAAYLLRYDSVYGPLDIPVRYENGRLNVGEHRCRIFREPSAQHIDFTALDVDVLLQCTGVHLSLQANASFLHAGARRIVVSAPPEDTMPIFAVGVNDHRYANERIISAASCSAVAIAPVLQVFDKAAGIDFAAVSMVHSYTADQRLHDGADESGEFRRSRSATANILPFSSSAAATVQRLLPEFEGRIDAHSIRIPLAAGTLYDFTLTLRRPLTQKEARQRLFDAENMQHLFNATDPLVASDIVANPANIIVQIQELRITAGRYLRLVGWQDNEYGYAARMLRLVERITPVL